MKKVVEVGEAREIQTPDRDYLSHIPGAPLDLARLAKQLHNQRRSQKEVGKLMGVSQSYVSTLLAVGSLPEHILARVEAGEIAFSTAYKLSSLDPEERDRLARQEKLTLQKVAHAARKAMVSRELLDIVESREPDGKRCPTCGRSR